MSKKEIDKISLDRIAKLHPKVREEVKQILEEVESRLTGKAKIRIAQGLRTIKEQDDLYAQGRTKPGPKVTNARGGSSYHNFGLAVDFVLLIDGKTASWDIRKDWDEDKVSDWMEVVEVFAKHGWAWGGNWKTLKDYPHFEKTFGYTLNDLRIKYNKKDFIKGTEYLNL